MTNQNASVMQFIKGQEICQIAFGMYDLQFNWGDGGLSCTGRVVYAPGTGGEVIWTEGQYQCCVCSSRESNRLMARQKEN